MATTDAQRKAVRRLVPLFIAMALQNFVLWYSIEKLFMTTIGFNSATISIMAAVYAATMLLIETPSGILADRWSRKGVLMIGAVALALSSFVGGVSLNLPMYVFAAVSWGIFYALYSGMYDSIIYDTLIEETGESKGYEKYNGRMQAINGVALAVSSLLGGVAGQLFGLRSAYFITIPFVLLSMIFLWRLREPMIHRSQPHASIKAQVSATFRGISTKGVTLWLTVTLILTGIVSQMIFEFNQLWLIALAVPVILFGPANAILLGSTSLGSLGAEFVSRHRRIITYSLVVILVAGLSLALTRSGVVVVVASFVLAVLFTAYEIVFEKLLHDRLASNVRAGSASAISSISKLFFIPVSLSFGFLAQAQTVFHAAWIIVGLIGVLVIVILATLAATKKSEHSSQL